MKIIGLPTFSINFKNLITLKIKGEFKDNQKLFLKSKDTEQEKGK